jgi:hypothetical protein
MYRSVAAIVCEGDGSEDEYTMIRKAELPRGEGEKEVKGGGLIIVLSSLSSNNPPHLSHVLTVCFFREFCVGGSGEVCLTR